MRQRFLFCGQNPDRNQLFYKHEWKWSSPNSNTNRELFLHILEQRLSDGFIVVNRFHCSTKFCHLIKILRASKDRMHVGKT